jgi:hypothetical protein
VAGVVTTAFLTGKATLQSTKILAEAAWIQDDSSGTVVYKDANLDNKEILNLIWREFIPPVAVGAVSIAAIIGANHIGTRRAAAFAAAFKISESLGEEYREKIVETLGVKKEEEVRAKVASDRMAGSAKNDPQIIVVPEAGCMFYDMFSDRYFASDIESVRKAVNDTNHQINTGYYATLSDFYDRIGLKRTELSDSLGWNHDQQLELNFVAIQMPGGKPALAIEYNRTPIQNYDRVM